MRADQQENYITCYWAGMTPRFLETARSAQVHAMAGRLGLSMYQVRRFAEEMGITLKEDEE